MGVSQLSAGGHGEEGIRHLETALQIRPDFEPALSALCAAHYRSKDWRQLEQTAARWLRHNPEAFGAYYYQAMTLLEGDLHPGAGKYAEANRLLRRSIEIQPLFAASRVALGKLLNQLDQPAQALREFQAAVSADPQNAAAQYQLAVTYRKLGESEKSRQALQTFNRMKADEQPWTIVFQLSKNTP
jgi:tetratricopeptide (TPR) repeat protein